MDEEVMSDGAMRDGARWATVALCAVLVVAGCSTGDGTDLDARVPAQTAAPATTTASAATVLDGTTAVAGGSEPTLPGEPTSTAPPPTAVSVPETGVPGLDDDDAFCAAWARFGGSFQVVAVHAAFGDGTAESTARYELIAAPTVVEAYEAMRATWPDELASEFDVAIDRRFGPLAARIGSGLTVLSDAGLDDAAAAELRDAWLAALATRDALAADLPVELSEATSVLVDGAVGDYLAVVGPWADDTTLVTDVATPLTDEYLATACPDQGALAGQEVG